MPIQKAFSRATPTYDRAAYVQQIVAMQLTDHLARAAPTAETILEIGSGTGLLTKMLLAQYPECRRIIASDLSESMLHHPRWHTFPARVARAVINGEFLAVPPHHFDLITSNLAWQWFVDPLHALTACTHHLAPHGQILISTLGPECFPIWRAACRQYGLSWQPPTHAMDTLKLKKLSEMLGKEWQVHTHHTTVTHPIASGHSFMRGLRALGATATKAPMLPTGKLRRVLDALASPYEELYDIVYLCINQRTAHDTP